MLLWARRRQQTGKYGRMTKPQHNFRTALRRTSTPYQAAGCISQRPLHLLPWVAGRFESRLCTQYWLTFRDWELKTEAVMLRRHASIYLKRRTTQEEGMIYKYATIPNNCVFIINSGTIILNWLVLWRLKDLRQEQNRSWNGALLNCLTLQKQSVRFTDHKT